LSFAHILEKSSNIGIVKLAERLSDTQLYTAIRRWGFGEPSGVNLPGEEAGQVRPPKQWSTRTHDALALGQEVTVTPLQLLAAYAAVANGGWLMRPRLVEWVMQGDDAQGFPSQVRRRVLSPQTVQHLNTMLVGVVERGTGTQAAVKGYTTAGQTGTAQHVVRGGAGHRQRLASFIGYVPAEAPQLAMLVMLEEPRHAKGDSEAAARVFQRVAQQALYYLQVGPSPPRNP
jgi:cell division protein FtsI (penicillin-binding protein 3)